MNPFLIAFAATGLVLALLGILMRQRAAARLARLETPTKKQKLAKTLWTVLAVAGGWLLSVSVITLIFHPYDHAIFTVELFPDRVALFGLPLSTTVLWAWIALAAVTALALLFRIVAFFRFQNKPGGLQNAVESAVEPVSRFADAIERIGVARHRRAADRRATRADMPARRRATAFSTRGQARRASADTPAKKAKRRKTLWVALAVVGGWLFVVIGIRLVFGPRQHEAFMVEISPERVDLLGFSLSTTVILTWVILAIVLVFSLLFRFLVFPRFKNEPRGLQNAIETAVEQISRYTDEKVEHASATLGSYIFTVAAFMVLCAALELFGLRAPTADLTMTLAMALITFIMINYYGIRRKGFFGRMKSLASPTPMVLPIRMICDCAVPISLACRLFGNMLGGMIVMELLYYALGSTAIGIPSFIGLYFNVFHPLIQAFIFITLTLSFINEAIETVE